MASLSNINGIFDVHSTGAVQFNGNHGASGQILKSNGNAAPTWIPQSDIVGAYLPLAGGTLTGATATASGISFTVGGTLTGSTANFSGDVTAATFNTLPIETARNNNANRIVRTNVHGYVDFGWINTTSGATTSTIDRIYASNDGYIRYVTPATFRTQVTDPYYAPAGTVSGVTSVATGSGLTGGTITTTGTLSLDRPNSALGAVLATYGTTAGSAGRIRCTAPFNTNTGKMFSIEITLYTSYAQHNYVVSAYMYSTTNQWYSPKAIYTTTGSATPDIYVGRDANGKAYISIANASYTGVLVHNMTRGYHTSVADTYDPWTITVNSGNENSVSVAVSTVYTSANLPSGSGVTSLVAGTGISLTNASGPAVTVAATTNFVGTTFTSRNNTGGIAVDSATSNMSGYCNTSSAAGYSDGGLFVAAYSSSWVSQIFSNFRTGEIAVRGKNSGTWQAWRTVWDSVNLPNPVQSSGVTSIATSNGITGGTITTTGTVSLTGTYTGRWNGTTGYYIKDTRAGDIPPNAETDHAMNLGFTNQVPGNGNWQSYIQMKGWTDGYTSWQIIGPSTTTAYENWYLRSGKGTTWNTAREIFHTGNFVPGNYLPLAGGTITGTLGLTGIASLGNTAPSRVLMSDSTDVKYNDLATARSQFNLSYTTFRRMSSTNDTNYWTGTWGWGATNMNSTLPGYGSGFFDVWSNPTGQPSGTSHWNGYQALHYKNTGNLYGYQVALGAGDPTNMYVRGIWGGTSWGSWYRMHNDKSALIKINDQVSISTYNDRNLKIQGASSSDAGITGYASNGGHVWQLYGSGNDYGFLNGNWASWDLRKTKNGNLYMNNNNTYYLNTSATSNINALTLIGTLSGQNGYFLQDLAVGFNSGAIGGKLNIQINSANGIGIKNNLNGVSNPTGLLSYTTASMNAGGYHMVFQAAPTSGSDTNMLLCNLNGNLRNRNNSYGQYSDETIKENITDATPKLEDVKKLKVKNFNFIGDDLKQIGLIAQETEKVFPGLVEDDLNPQGDRIKSLKYSVLVPILVKAIQELEVRVKELENK